MTERAPPIHLFLSVTAYTLNVTAVWARTETATVWNIIIHFVCQQLTECWHGEHLRMGEIVRRECERTAIRRQMSIGMEWYRGWTHRIRMMKQDDIDPNEVKHGGIPTLQHIESHCDSRRLKTYNNE